METLGVFWTFWGSVHRTVIVGSPHYGLKSVQGFVCDRAHDVWGFRPNLNMKRFSGKVHVHVVCYSACGLDTKPPVICVHLRPPCPSSLSISVISKVQHWSLTYASYWRLNTPRLSQPARTTSMIWQQLFACQSSCQWLREHRSSCRMPSMQMHACPSDPGLF